MNVMSWYNWQKIKKKKKAHKFMVSLTTDSVLNLMKYNYLHLATPKLCICTVFSKGLIDTV